VLNVQAEIHARWIWFNVAEGWRPALTTIEAAKMARAKNVNLVNRR
jgi:hypothetical protein